MLLMTNDGELTLHLTHPSHEAGKTYLVSVRGDLKRISEMEQPMEIDGYTVQPAHVLIRDQASDTEAHLEITIHEGRNRQIRKMCEKCGLEVRRLKRIADGRAAFGHKAGTRKMARLDTGGNCVFERVLRKSCKTL